MSQVKLLLCLLLQSIFLFHSSNGMYFYLDTSSEKCFSEDMMEKTMAVAKYRSEQYNPQTNFYQENPSLGIRILVKEIHTGHIIKDQKGASSGRVVFTSAGSGMYSLCLSTNHTGWFSHELARVHFDLAVGGSVDLDHGKEEGDRLSDLAERARDLNYRIGEIRREQSMQRDREANFRNLSETVNSKVVWWAFVQIIVLGITCMWQVRHLKGFFEAKKLV